MAGQRHQSTQQAEPQATGCLPALIRFVWMMFGNILLLVCAVLVARQIAPVLMDVVFFGLVAGLILLRYVDITRLKGETADGKPATLADWRRYALVITIASIGLWLLARMAGARGWV